MVVVVELEVGVMVVVLLSLLFKCLYHISEPICVMEHIKASMMLFMQKCITSYCCYTMYVIF